MRTVLSVASQCSRLTQHTVDLAAQLRYHAPQLHSQLFSTSALPPFQLLPPPPSQPPPPLYAIVGLGNPGPQYAATRHNVGALCLQSLARAYGLSFDAHRPQHLCRLAQCVRTLPLTPSRTRHPASPPPTSPPRHLLLALPGLYMNQSGSALLSLLAGYPQLSTRRTVLLYDDVALPLGALRIATRGGDAGHRGLGDVVQRLSEAGRGSDGAGLVRVRVGVGRLGVDGASGGGVGKGGLAAYVLGRFGRDEMAVLESEVYAKVRRVVEGIAAGEVERMMNTYNGKASRNVDGRSHKSEPRQMKERTPGSDSSETAERTTASDNSETAAAAVT